MEEILSDVFSGFMSKAINDGCDITKEKIKNVIEDKSNRSFSTKIYSIIVDLLNEITGNKYEDTDNLYKAAEELFKIYKDCHDNTKSVKSGLKILISDVNDFMCEYFIERFWSRVCSDDDLYKEISIILQKQGIECNRTELQQLNRKMDNNHREYIEELRNLSEKISEKSNSETTLHQKNSSVKNRTDEYSKIWNKNMFLNDFDKRDENTGVNVKLKELYSEEYLPHYLWKNGVEERDDLKELLYEYIVCNDSERKMLLILGQPGIGKSTLIAWIVSNFADQKDNILVYQFASDLKNIYWQETAGKYDFADKILQALEIKYDTLEGKILILDGFDEISARDREDILNQLYWRLIERGLLKSFTLIVTCRENYINDMYGVQCNYITLQPWTKKQINDFYDKYMKTTHKVISQNTKNKLAENREIFGIPLILYMVVALDISIEAESSVGDIYDKIFSLDGAIYDRCIQNKSFEKKHRISNIKNYIHQISRGIAIWMFENKPDESYIPQEAYEKICDNVIIEGQMQDYADIKQDFKIGSYFKLVKYCEGIETEKLYFVHRSIYEYFVAETIYNSIEKTMLELTYTDESQEKLAEKIAYYLKT